jgi:hypothetical protein
MTYRFHKELYSTVPMLPEHYSTLYLYLLYCFRFCFLPENSTHLLQPLDVSVFGPLKRRWREVLEAWKDECTLNNISYPTLPKQVQYQFLVCLHCMKE